MESKNPERIYNWIDTHLSLARLYGGCNFNGDEYVIAYNEEGQPLVRKDLLKKPKAAKKPKRPAAPGLPLQPNG